jgi:hypothetical protein
MLEGGITIRVGGRDNKNGLRLVKVGVNGVGGIN